MTHIDDALQRMHQAEQSGQVRIPSKKLRIFILFNIEISIISLSTDFNPINNS
jgi:hypothetical protein